MKKNIIRLAVASAFAFGSVAHAATITDSFLIGHQLTELSSTVGASGSVASGSLTQFDTSLGTLTGISITLTGESISNTQLTNTSLASQPFKYYSELDWYFEVLDDATDSSYVNPFQTHLAGNGIGLFDAGYVLAAGATIDLGTTVTSDSFIHNVDSADFADYLGLGTVNVGCNTNTNSTFSGGGGNIITAQTSTGSCAASITYTYTEASVAVPEPSMVALLGLGLIGIGLSRRKMK